MIADQGVHAGHELEQLGTHDVEPLAVRAPQAGTGALLEAAMAGEALARRPIHAGLVPRA